MARVHVGSVNMASAASGSIMIQSDQSVRKGIARHLFVAFDSIHIHMDVALAVAVGRSTVVAHLFVVAVVDLPIAKSRDASKELCFHTVQPTLSTVKKSSSWCSKTTGAPGWYMGSLCLKRRLNW
jgi:hypothetical protein